MNIERLINTENRLSRSMIGGICSTLLLGLLFLIQNFVVNVPILGLLFPHLIIYKPIFEQMPNKELDLLIASFTFAVFFLFGVISAFLGKTWLKSFIIWFVFVLVWGGVGAFIITIRLMS